MPTTTVSKTEYERENGDVQRQYRTTIPKQLAEAFDLCGKTIEWGVESQSALRVDVVDDE